MSFARTFPAAMRVTSSLTDARSATAVGLPFPLPLFPWPLFPLPPLAIVLPLRANIDRRCENVRLQALFNRFFNSEKRFSNCAKRSNMVVGVGAHIASRNFLMIMEQQL